jgi:hypothetical protein
LYWKALTYYTVDNKMGRDSMRRYVEEHPFATLPPGQTLSALRWTGNFSRDLAVISNEPWIDNYNWLVTVQPLNQERRYQKEVMLNLISALGLIDWNAQCNMLYNYSIIFGDDSNDVNLAWQTIRSTRKTQERAGEDTTEFYIITFPLKPIQSTATPSTPVYTTELRVQANPFIENIALNVVVGSAIELQVDICDELGRVLYTKELGYQVKGSHNFTIETKSWSSGIYYVRLSTGRGEVKTVKVVKE